MFGLHNRQGEARGEERKGCDVVATTHPPTSAVDGTKLVNSWTKAGGYG